MAAFESALKKLLGGKVAAFFMKNLLLFAAVILTVQIWLAIRYQLQVDREIEIPVTIQTQGDEVPLGTPSPDKVTVFLSGGSSLVNNLTGRELKLVLNTRQAEKKEEGNITRCTWTVSNSNIEAPIGVRIKNVSPTQINLSLDKFISDELAVEAIWNESELPAGYKIGNVTIEPKKVKVRAPSSKLSLLTKIRTTPIPLNNITHSFDCDQDIDSTKYADIDFDRKNVLVQVEVLRRTRTRSFKTLPVRILIPSASRQQAMTCEIVSNPTVDLEVSGAENVVNSLRREDIFIFANISEFLKPGLYQIDLRFAIEKNGISSFKITPSKVNVKLERISRR